MRSRNALSKVPTNKSRPNLSKTFPLKEISHMASIIYWSIQQRNNSIGLYKYYKDATLERDYEKLVGD